MYVYIGDYQLIPVLKLIYKTPKQNLCDKLIRQNYRTAIVL